MEMGNRKRRKWETGDEKWAFIFLHNCMPSLHSATPVHFWSGLLPQRSRSKDYSICISLIHTKSIIIDNELKGLETA